MNLQESIRRILREESNIPRVILRRVTIDELDKIFERSLDENTEDYENPLEIMYGQPYKVFAKFVIDIMISELEGNFDIPYINDEDEYIEKYREPLLRHYAPIIKDRYMDITSNNVDESILREDKKPITWVRRRYGLIDDEFNRLMHKVYGPDKICMYRSGEELVMVVTEAVAENLYFNTFYNLDDESKEWEEVYDSIIGYMQYKYGKKLEEYYHINCGN